MTTLAAIQGDGWAVIGADSQASDDSGYTMAIVTGKIFKNGPALIAGAGSVRGINILQFGWKAPRITASEDVDSYITKKFIPSMRKTFIESGYDMKAEADVAQNDNIWIVAVRGSLYSVDEDYSWERCSRKLYMGGSGGKYALGALDALGASFANSPEEASAHIERAITSAIKYDAFSGGAITTLTQYA